MGRLRAAAGGSTALVVLALISGAAQAATYAVRELPTLVGHAKDPYQFAQAIDAKGRVLAAVQVVRHQQGYYLSERCRLQHCRRLTTRHDSTLWYSMNEAGATAGLVWRDDTSWAALRIPGRGVSYLTPGVAYDANAGNTAVGATEDVKPFLYDTSLHMLPIPGGGRQGRAHAINDHGVVAGEFYLPNGDIHAFIYQNGFSTDVTAELPRYSDAGIADINNAGVAVGCAEERGGGPMQVARFESGKMTYLGALVEGTRTGTCARAIDEAGRLVVGDGDVDPLDATKRHGFLHDAAGLHDLNDLLRPGDAKRYMIYGAMDVNDAGQIAATALRASDQAWLAVRLDPVP
jgi:probable HAF family extracellular repeat protein